MKKEKITKFSDFMYYYKWHMVITFFVVLLVVSFVHSCTTKVEDDLAVSMLISNYAAVDASEKMSADFTEAGLIPDIDGDGISKVYVNIVTVPLEAKSQEDVMANYQASIALAADDSILFLVDEDLLELYETQGDFGDISDKAAEFGYGEDMVYTAEDGTVMGISLKGNEYLESKGIVTDTLYACFRPIPEGELNTEVTSKIKAADDILAFILK